MAKISSQALVPARLEPQPLGLTVRTPRFLPSARSAPSLPFSLTLGTPPGVEESRKLPSNTSTFLGHAVPSPPPTTTRSQPRFTSQSCQRPVVVTKSAPSDSHSQADCSPGDCTPSTAVLGAQASVEVLGPNSRRVSASIDVHAPLLSVWSVLTDYYRLAEYVPSLAKNEVLEIKERGARLLQVGEQDVAMGIKFQARVVVDVEEEPEELIPYTSPAWPPESLNLDATSQGDTTVVPFSVPIGSGGQAAAAAVAQAAAAAPAFLRRRAIQFIMREGDFAAFTGRWVLQEDKPKQAGDGTTTLTYAVDVTPHFWLPVALVEGRIVKEIGTNLASVAVEACRRASFAR